MAPLRSTLSRCSWWSPLVKRMSRRCPFSCVSVSTTPGKYWIGIRRTQSPRARMRSRSSEEVGFPVISSRVSINESVKPRLPYPWMGMFLCSILGRSALAASRDPPLSSTRSRNSSVAPSKWTLFSQRVSSASMMRVVFIRSHPHVAGVEASGLGGILSSLNDRPSVGKEDELAPREPPAKKIGVHDDLRSLAQLSQSRGDLFERERSGASRPNLDRVSTAERERLALGSASEILEPSEPTRGANLSPS